MSKKTAVVLKIDKALQLLKELGFPRQQLNERSALTLLALLNLKPDDSWSEASNPLIGITPIMNFISEHFNKHYAPNTRETIRRQTMHQFVQAALVLKNPDMPTRPTNSPYYVYQIEPSALELIRVYHTVEWKDTLSKYKKRVKTLTHLYDQEREKHRIPLRIRKGEKIDLSPGGQNVLIKRIIDDFCAIYTPGGITVYVGDAEKKYAYFDERLLSKLGVEIEIHGQMPDVVIYCPDREWLVLIEAVTSHGPINPKRKIELEQLFKSTKFGIVFITAFLSRHEMLKYLGDISWETEVWVAESPTHLIHFNGEKFLGPYES